MSLKAIHIYNSKIEVFLKFFSVSVTLFHFYVGCFGSLIIIIIFNSVDDYYNTICIFTIINKDCLKSLRLI